MSIFLKTQELMHTNFLPNANFLHELSLYRIIINIFRQLRRKNSIFLGLILYISKNQILLL